MTPIRVSPSGDRASGHCHRQVREVARAAAEQMYEQLMRDNLVFSAWKAQNPGATAAALRTCFVRRVWGRCIPFARATLAQMLTGPLDTRMKESIMQVLTLDNSLRRGRSAAMEGPDA